MPIDTDGIVHYLLAGGAVTDLFRGPLPDQDATALVNRLKTEADQHWGKDPRLSLMLAEHIVQIGKTRNDIGQVALGTMARGDALRFLGQMEMAWTTLDEAGRLYRLAGDDVGWGRTRIGRLLASASVGCVDEALEDARQARAIFERYGATDRLLRLLLNTAIVYSDSLGNYHRALDLYREAQTIARELGEAGRHFEAVIALDMGYAFYYLGEFREAQAAYAHARELLAEQDDVFASASAELNVAYMAQTQGRYREALQKLRWARAAFGERWPLDAALAGRDEIECNLALNRFREALDLADSVIAQFQNLGATLELARTLILRAIAAAELGDWAGASTDLDAAEPIFAGLGATGWIATTRLRRAQIAFRRGDFAAALDQAEAASADFAAQRQIALYAESILLRGQVMFTQGALPSAAESATQALQIARLDLLPTIRYGAHLLLGHIAQQSGRGQRALRHYSAAIGTLERMQRGLTITLRPSFLANKGEALSALIGLSLERGEPERAFEALERAKSQVLLGYLANQGALRWQSAEPETQALIDTLNCLRDEHQALYALAHRQESPNEAHKSAITPQRALADLARCERQMRAISEQLYLRTGGDDPARAVTPPRLPEIQAAVAEGELLIEYFNDGEQVWAFALDSTTLTVHRMPITLPALDKLIGALQFNIACALQVGRTSPALAGLTGLARRLLGQLDAALLAPLAGRIAQRSRLVIVPYGALHYLPFHLLHQGAGYRIEQAEIVILPAAGLATHRSPRRAAGALAIAHTWNGELPQDHPRSAARPWAFRRRVVHRWPGDAGSAPGRAASDPAYRRSWAVSDRSAGPVLHPARGRPAQHG